MDLGHTVKDVALMAMIALYLWLGIAGYAMILMYLWRKNRVAAREKQ